MTDPWRLCEDDVIHSIVRWPNNMNDRPSTTCRINRNNPPLKIGDVVVMDRQPPGRVITEYLDGTVDVVFSPIGGGSANDAISEEQKFLDRMTLSDPTRLPVENVCVPSWDSDDKPVCKECKGTGYWIKPAGGRNPKTPCSEGCKPK